jgi:hypothetical protein
MLGQCHASRVRMLGHSGVPVVLSQVLLCYCAHTYACSIALTSQFKN